MACTTQDKRGDTLQLQATVIALMSWRKTDPDPSQWITPDQRVAMKRALAVIDLIVASNSWQSWEAFKSETIGKALRISQPKKKKTEVERTPEQISNDDEIAFENAIRILENVINPDPDDDYDTDEVSSDDENSSPDADSTAERSRIQRFSRGGYGISKISDWALQSWNSWLGTSVDTSSSFPSRSVGTSRAQGDTVDSMV